VASVRARSIRLGERVIADLRLECPRFVHDGGLVRCSGGRLDLPGVLSRVELDLEVHPDAGRGQLLLGFGPGEAAHLTLDPDGSVRARLQGLDVRRVAEQIPLLAELAVQGRVDAELEYRAEGAGRAASFSGRLAEAGFASVDGLQAAEGLELAFTGRAAASADGWRWAGALDWRAGEAYLHPLYLTAGASLQAAGELRADVLSVDEAVLALEGVRSIALQGRLDTTSGALLEAGLSVADADLAVVGPRYLAPLLMPAQAARMRFAGHFSAGLRVEHGALVAADLAFNQAGLSLADGLVSFGPLDGGVPWRADEATVARLSVAGGHWEKLRLGAFEIEAGLRGNGLSMVHLSIPLLDGAVVVQDLRLERREAGWFGSGGAVVEPISMPLLTEALGLPSMAGVLSAALPGMRVSPGAVVLDGALVVSVFGGYIQVSELRILEPFGVAPHLFVDVDARHLDLAQVTETFSFGSITGFVDARVGGLELSRWRPVRFDARVASSPGRYPRRISQRAVQNIGALGGAGAVAAIQRSMLGFFESFGYREIGLSCVLADGVCLMGGLTQGARDDGGFVLVRGGGIPALNVIGYNRRVDWHELLDRLQRVIESNAPPVVR
jgi:hypothetical protein